MAYTPFQTPPSTAVPELGGSVVSTPASAKESKEAKEPEPAVTAPPAPVEHENAEHEVEGGAAKDGDSSAQPGLVSKFMEMLH